MVFLLAKLVAVDPAERIARLEAELAAQRARSAALKDQLAFADISHGVRAVSRALNAVLQRTDLPFKKTLDQMCATTGAALHFARYIVLYVEPDQDGNAQLVGRHQGFCDEAALVRQLKRQDATPEEIGEFGDRMAEIRDAARRDNELVHQIFGTTVFPREDRKILQQKEARRNLLIRHMQEPGETQEKALDIARRIGEVATSQIFEFDWEKFSPFQKSLVEKHRAHPPAGGLDALPC